MPAPDNALTGASERRFIRHHARRRLGLDPGALVVLHHGPLAPRSGIDTIILALALLRRDHGIGATLLVAGDQHSVTASVERARLRQLARELGIDADVHFMAANIGGDCFAASDVLISMPWPAQGSAPLHHQAMGSIRPVLMAGTGARAIPVIDGVTGWLVTPRDAAALARHLARLQRQPELVQAVDIACRLQVPA